MIELLYFEFVDKVDGLLELFGVDEFFDHTFDHIRPAGYLEFGDIDGLSGKVVPETSFV